MGSRVQRSIPQSRPQNRSGPNGFKAPPAAIRAESMAALERLAAEHGAGRIVEAEAGYRAILARDPNNPDALQLLGVARHQQDDGAAALDFLTRAIAIDDSRADFFVNLAKVQSDGGNHADAIASLNRALALDPRHVQAYSSLAAVWLKSGDPARAKKTLETALRHLPQTPGFHQVLGEILSQTGSPANAIAQFDAEIAVDPAAKLAHFGKAFACELLGRFDDALQSYHDSFFGLGAFATRPHAADYRRLFADDKCEIQHLGILGRVLGHLGRTEEALDLFAAMADARPGDGSVLTDVGTCLTTLDRHDLAIPYFRRAIALDDTQYSAHNNLGNCYLVAHEYETAVECYKKALKVVARGVEPHINLIRALRHLNRLDEANFYAHATATLTDLQPGHYANLFQIFQVTCDFDGLRSLGDLFALTDRFHTSGMSAVFLDLLVHCETEDDLARMLALHRKWGVHIAERARANPLPPKSPRPRVVGQKIRLGFLSSDLRGHSVGSFLTVLLLNYDKSRFEIFCYTSQRAIGDTLQNLFAQNVDRFTFLENRSDREVAQVIRDDDVDVLIELNAFTLGTKMEALAYRAAPIQVSWLGYPYSSGLAEADYLLVDRYVKPLREDLLVERPLVLPESWVCFGNFARVPVCEDLPLDRNGIVTFGTQNNPYKFTPKTIGLWAAVLREMPTSRFVVVRPEVTSVMLCRNVIREFIKHGIDADRIQFAANQSGDGSHFKYYNELDLTLDTFPLTGGTTTCDALWMGCPVVTLVGHAMHQRMSYSILSNVGLQDLCATSEEGFVAAAVALANDTARLRELRRELRPRLETSALCRKEHWLAGFQDAVAKAVAERLG